MRRAFAVAALSAVLMTSAASAEDPAGDAAAARNRERRAMIDEIKKGVAPASVAKDVEAIGDPVTSQLAALDCTAFYCDQLKDAAAKRDAQGKELFTYYRKHFGRSSAPTPEEESAYAVMELRNRALCTALTDAEGNVELLRKASLRAGTKTPSDDAGAAALADAVRSVMRSAHGTLVRARLFEAIDGPFVASLLPEAEKAATKGESREERVGALRCLEKLGARNHLAVLQPCLDDQDSFVRRATFPVFAAAASREAVDALVARMAKEIGVPASELGAALARLTGQLFGESAKGWADWWAAARDTWQGPPAVPPQPPARKGSEGTKYFGLALDSMRVLFIIDRSLSMSFPVAYNGRNLRSLSATDETKIDVARKELKQAITGLADGASFNVIAFGFTTKPFSAKLVEANLDNRKRALKWVDEIDLDGSTNLGGTLIEAFDSLTPGFKPKDSEIADTIVVLTDGVPNCGPIGHEDDVLSEVRRLNRDKTVVLHCIYLGNEGNVTFMQKLAAENGGQFVHHAK